MTAEPIQTKADILKHLIKRECAAERLLDYITFTTLGYKVSVFAGMVCAALDQFLVDVKAGKRPILILQAPPQHGKSEIATRKFPAFVMGRDPSLRIGCASYNQDKARDFAQDVRRNLADSRNHQAVFPVTLAKRKFDVNRMGEFTAPNGSGSYIGVGVGTGLTGRPVDIGIIDDPTKDAEEALSEVTKESQWNWYQSVFTTRLSEHSGQIVMATQWAEDDLPARIAAQYAKDPRLTMLRFPAINLPSEVGYNPELPDGALVPQLHSLTALFEQKNLMSDYWWSALYQQSAKSLGGNVFKEIGIQYYQPKDLPERFDTIVDSWDCTFKDTDGTDYVVGQKWGKKGANSYLLRSIRGRMGFTQTAEKVEWLQDQEPRPFKVLIEDKANGPAVIDFLKMTVPRLFAIEPDGSKLARAYAVTSVWEAKNVFLPHPDYAPAVMLDSGRPGQVKTLTSELTIFNAGAHDDQVDSMTQALRELYPLFGRLKISPEALKLAAQR